MDQREEKRVSIAKAREAAKKDAEMKSQKIEVNDDFEIITHELYVTELKNKIKAMRLRPLPPAGKRWKRTQFDELEEQGFFGDASIVITELVLILNGKSNKSSAKRALIRSMCSEVYNQVRDQFKVVPAKN